MRRRDFFRTTGMGAALVLAGGVLSSAFAEDDAKKGTLRPAGEQPNIVLIMADDLGYQYIGCNGSTTHKTPVLDKLAETGTRFEYCFSQPICTPSRVQIMTGIYNVRNYVRFGLLPRNETTFGHLLKRAGYATCVVGKWQLGREKDSPKHFGFDESCLWQHTRRPGRYANPGLEINGEETSPEETRGKYGPDIVTDYACEFMEKNKDKPFLVYYPMILTHAPYDPTPDSPGWNPTGTGPKGKRLKVGGNNFSDMITYMDKVIGKLVAKLDELALRENTLVLFTTDNGTGGKGKGQMNDHGTREPFITNCPGTIPAGRVNRDLIDFSDFLPTLCEAAGAEVPEALDIDGRSFLPQLKGEQGDPRDWIYCWYSRNGGTGASFARGHKYRLYSSGKFEDVTDGFQPKAIDTPTVKEGEAADALAMLKGVLDRYDPLRAKALASFGQREKMAKKPNASK